MSTNNISHDIPQLEHSLSKNFQKISFILFSITSFILSFNLYINLVSTIYEKILMAGLNIAFESFKIYSIILYHSYANFILLYRTKIPKDIFKTFKKKKLVHLILYIILACLSFVASLGFTLTAIYKHSQQQTFLTTFSSQKETIDLLLIEYDKQINQIDSQITILQKTLDSLPTDFITRKQQLNTQIEKFIEQKNNISHKKQEKIIERNDLIIKEKESRSTINRSMFSLLAEVFKTSDLNIMLIILVFTSMFIEIGIFITSPKLNFDTSDIIKQKKQSSSENKETLNLNVETPKKEKKQIKIKNKEKILTSDNTKIETPVDVEEKETISNKNQKTNSYKRSYLIKMLLENPKRLNNLNDMEVEYSNSAELNLKESNRLINFLLNYIPPNSLKKPLLEVNKDKTAYISAYSYDEILKYLKNLNIL